MTRRASARPDDITYSVNSLKLPALNSTAVEDFVCCFVHFIRLVCLNEFLHVLSIFVVFTSHDQVYVRRIFIFNKDTVFCRRQADLAGVGGVDDRQCDLSIVQRTRQLRRFQLAPHGILRPRALRRCAQEDKVCSSVPPPDPPSCLHPPPLHYGGFSQSTHFGAGGATPFPGRMATADRPEEGRPPTRSIVEQGGSS